MLVGEEQKEVLILKDQITLINNYDEGDWVDVETDGVKVKIIRVNEEETAKVKKRIQTKLDLLRSRMGKNFGDGKKPD